MKIEAKVSFVGSGTYGNDLRLVLLTVQQISLEVIIYNFWRYLAKTTSPVQQVNTNADNLVLIC